MSVTGSKESVNTICGKAMLRKCVIAPKKIRSLVNLIRKNTIKDARATLSCNQKKCATYIDKLLLSAATNCEKKCAENNVKSYNVDDFFIKEIRADYAGALKRTLPATHGRACIKKRRFSNVFVVVERREETEDVGKTKKHVKKNKN